MRSSFGQRLATLREWAGLSQNELSRILGLAVSSLSRMESGEMTNPTVDTLDRICGFYGARREWLLDGQEPLFIPETAEDARERYFSLLREKLGSEEDWARREQQLLAEISVRLAQIPHATKEAWKVYRQQIIHAIDAHASAHLPSGSVTMARIRMGEASARAKRK